MQGACHGGRSVFLRELFLESNPRIGEVALDAMASLPADVAIYLPTLALAISVRPRDIYTPAASTLAHHTLNECELLFAGDQGHLGRLTSLQRKHAGARTTHHSRVRLRIGVTVPLLATA